MTMTMIQVILYLSVAIHLVHCWPIHSRSRRNSDSVPDCNHLVLDCSEGSAHKQHITGFNSIFENFFRKLNNAVRLNITVL